MMNSMHYLVRALILSGCCASVVVAQVRAEAVARVFGIRTNTASGTAFALEENGRQYIITAKHLLPAIAGKTKVQLRRPDTQRWLETEVTVLHCGPNVDIAVLCPQSAFLSLKQLSILVGSENISLGQEVFFLGFPFNFERPATFKEGKFLLPFVKRAVVSALVEEGDVQVLYLDGYNNPGFSGGPVVAWDPKENRSRIIGVVSGYRNEPRPVRIRDGGRDTPLYVDSNSGIIVAYPINAALQVIRKNPIGAIVK